ncbi:MAG: FAD/NAD(P)-binding protein [Candidatus Zixiibacteriota bacterium]|nr:MAG: FAD/NAD(P)-binding protein [candidate division Zixibacteria bacterium]
MVPRPHVIKRVRRDTKDTFTIELVGAENPTGMFFSPGQFNMLYAFGAGEIPVSISGDPTKTKRLIHTVRVVGPVTRALRVLKAGDTIGVRGPYGTPWPVEKAEGSDVVLVAGGIGLAAIRPALYYLLANRNKYGKIALLYGTRTPADILYRSELESWRGRFDLEVDVTVDRGDSSWWGNVGVVPMLIPRAQFDPLSAVAMMCGPEIMMRFSVMALRKQGLTTDNIYVSMERNMKCAIGLCGHCQYGGRFVCKDGPVFAFDSIVDLFNKREI